ncbi:N-6 DNA methylase [Tyzzerella nexilis]|nr:N-6 DNA methylase [[Clostridium] nexile]NSD88005.1 N-6 DNA methylase [[Clostridium] nexile]
MRELGNISVYGGFCLAYVAYLSLKNKINDVYQLIEYMELTFSVERVSFIKGNIENLWNVALEIGEEYSEDTLLAVVLWWPLQGNKFMGECETPQSVVKLANEILQISKDKVADFCSGIGAFLMSAIEKNPESQFYGVEIVTDVKEVAEIRTELISDQVKIERKSVLNINDNMMFDKIFCDYPWGIKTKDSIGNNGELKAIYDVIPEVQKAAAGDWAFIINVMNHLNKNGKAVVSVSNGVTWNGGINTVIREKFVKEGFVEAVIALPSNLYLNTGIACSLLVLSRNNKNIRMIDATEMVSIGRRQNVLNDENVSKIIELLNTDDDNSKLVSIKEMAENEYIFNPSRYLQKEMVVKNGVPFESVIKNITRGAQIKAAVLDEIVSDEPTNMQYLMLANLQDGIISEDLPYLKEMNPKYEKYCIKNGSLVISKNVSPVKMAIASVKEGNKILANGNLYVIELDEDKINPYFLKAYLESENGKAALSRVAVGATLLNLPVEGLKKITIPLPDLKSQKIIADKYYTKIKEIKELKYKLEKATAELGHIYTEEK